MNDHFGVTFYSLRGDSVPAIIAWDPKVVESLFPMVFRVDDPTGISPLAQTVMQSPWKDGYLCLWHRFGAFSLPDLVESVTVAAEGSGLPVVLFREPFLERPDDVNVDFQKDDNGHWVIADQWVDHLRKTFKDLPVFVEPDDITTIREITDRVVLSRELMMMREWVSPPMTHRCSLARIRSGGQINIWSAGSDDRESHIRQIAQHPDMLACLARREQVNTLAFVSDQLYHVRVQPDDDQHLGLFSSVEGSIIQFRIPARSPENV